MKQQPSLKKLCSMGMMSVPESEARAKVAKVVDFTSINVYPSKYKIVGDEVVLKSIFIENVDQQREALKALNTTVLIGDMIRLDFKFGHYSEGEWIDYFVNGVYKVKSIIPNPKTCEILMLLSPCK